MTWETSFSTLACPAWSVDEIIGRASQWGYDGIEFRVVLGELDLWKLSAFQGSGLAETRRALVDHGLILPCVQSSARFDSPDPRVRRENLDNAEQIAELAARLGSPAVRVFGDRVQPGCTFDDTAGWIAESLVLLREKLRPANIAVWLETHGNFATAQAVAEVIAKTEDDVQIIWDPANALEEFGESPLQAGTTFGSSIRHVHLKDFRVNRENGYEYTLMGEGEMPLDEVRSVLVELNYNGFISFEWEKHWHPELANPEVALPHFARWVREIWLPIYNDGK